MEDELTTPSMTPSQPGTEEKCLKWLETVTSQAYTNPKTHFEPRLRLEDIETYQDDIVGTNDSQMCRSCDAATEIRLGSRRNKGRPQSASRIGSRNATAASGGDCLKSASQCSLGGSSSGSGSRSDWKRCFSLNNSPREERRMSFGGGGGGGGGAGCREGSSSLSSSLKRSLSLSPVKLPQIVPRSTAVTRYKEMVARKLSVGSLSADGRSHHTNGLVLTKVLLDYHDKQQQKSQDQAEAEVHSNARVLATALQDKRKKKRHVRNTSFGSEMSQSSSWRSSQTKGSSMDKLSPTSEALVIAQTAEPWEDGLERADSMECLAAAPSKNSQLPTSTTSTQPLLPARRKSLSKMTTTTTTATTLLLH
ncbi:uncharacterized protein [Oscarella lobularis]|uniref:uncharacterized protein n=1 Tax=Oscarella lobularis TaxID=121494 RepID=UPI003313692F